MGLCSTPHPPAPFTSVGTRELNPPLNPAPTTSKCGVIQLPPPDVLHQGMEMETHFLYKKMGTHVALGPNHTYYIG